MEERGRRDLLRALCDLEGGGSVLRNLLTLLSL